MFFRVEKVGRKRSAAQRGVSFAVFFLFFLVAAPLYASTEILSSILASDTSWTLAGSPYILPDHNTLQINNGVTLTIEPSVVVQFGYKSRIEGPGRVSAHGLPNQKITLTSIDETLGGGDGSLVDTGWTIEMGQPSGSVTNGPYEFEHVIIEHSNGVYFNRQPVTLRDITVLDSDIGLRFFLSEIDIDGLTISNVGSPIGSTGGSGSIKNATSTHSGALQQVLTLGGFNYSLSNISITNSGLQGALLLQSSTVEAENLNLSGGQGGGVLVQNNFGTGPATLHLASSTIEGFATDGIRVVASFLTITGSKIRNNSTGINLWDGNFGSVGETHVSGSSFSGNQFAVSSIAGGVVDMRGNYWGDPSGPFHPVFHPQGLGQAIFGGVLFDPWLLSDPFILPEKHIDPVIIIPGLLGSAEKNGIWLIDPIFHVYDNLIETLEANGYVLGVDLFTFPYDWRNSNVDTAILLGSKIASILSTCSCSKVDLVAHSMGGLVARQYIQSLSYDHDVDQLIFLGTPHLGSPKAYLTWEAGESVNELSERFIKTLLSREAKKAGYPSLFDYIHQRPIVSFQELLPITDYLLDKASTTLRTYPINYPRNIFLENLNNNISALLNSGVDITNIIGDIGTSTIFTIRVVPSVNLPFWQDGSPDRPSSDEGLELGSGDGTVSLQSSEFVGFDSVVLDKKHLDLPTDGEKIVYKNLSGKEPSTFVDKPRIYNFKILIIKILSPADIVVVAPDGKKVGKDFETGDEFNEIPDAFYSGYVTDDEYVTIPNPLDGEYQVVTEGTGSGGEYTIATGLISDDGTAEASFSGQTLPGLITPISIPIDTESDTISITPVDILPPDITIVSPEVRNYTRSEILPVKILFSDSGVGVATTSVAFNGKIIMASSTVDLFYEKLGTSTLSAFAEDFVGNGATSTVQIKIIATPQSLISDIGKSYALGWINDQKVKSRLTNEVKIMTVLVKRYGKIVQGIDKILGRAFLKQLANLHPKYINDQAYNLLVEDINWLINN